MIRFDVLIVGAGHGGAQAAIALRRQGFEGTIGIAGAEPDLPYERPPLSKDYLAGEKAFDRMLIRPLSFWEERGIRFLLGRRVEAIDAEAYRATLSDGVEAGYGVLIWAAGGSARRLACTGADLEGVHTIRSRADADRIMAQLPHARRVAVIGGGYIGLETAAVLTGLGKEVVLVEALDRVLARVAGEPVSRFYEAEHRARGVDLRTGAAVEEIAGSDGMATGIRLAGGEFLPADLIVVGIGIDAAAAPLAAAGAESGDGVHVDEFCRTSLPDTYAIGDCAAHRNRFAGGARVRLESVQNAHDQAVTAAKAIAGRPEPYASLPWFWSNQYDLKLQTAGLSHGHDEMVVRGDPAARSFSTVYLRRGRVVAIECINAARDYVQGRRLILDGAAPDKRRLADPAIALKDVAA